MQNPAGRLEEQGFTKESELNHQELINFILPWIYRRNTVMISYAVSLLVFLGLTTYSLISYLNSCESGVIDVLISVASGLGFSLLIIPVHELIHGAAYKLSGAPSIQFRANWKQFYFMALAHHFVMGARQFRFVGLLPFVVISVGLLAAAFQSQCYWQLTLFSMTFFHATMCTGDFALLSYFESNRHRQLVTFDDTINNVTYFYSRPLPSGNS